MLGSASSSGKVEIDTGAGTAGARVSIVSEAELTGEAGTGTSSTALRASSRMTVDIQSGSQVKHSIPAR